MKALCKLGKSELAEYLPILCATIAEARYVCRKCGRVADRKALLCKPISISKVVKSDAVSDK